MNTDKKSKVLNNKKSYAGPLVIGVILILVTGIVYYYKTDSKANSQVPESSMITATVSGDSLLYPVSLFDSGKALHFEYKYNGSTIRYFILKSSDGVVRAAFDACDVCWRANKGYVQDGDFMVCQNCGRRFPSVQVNLVQGGCNPASLQRTIDGDKLVLKKSDIEKGISFFDFSGGV